MWGDEKEDETTTTSKKACETKPPQFLVLSFLSGTLALSFQGQLFQAVRYDVVVIFVY